MACHLTSLLPRSKGVFMKHGTSQQCVLSDAVVRRSRPKSELIDLWRCRSRPFCKPHRTIGHHAETER